MRKRTLEPQSTSSALFCFALAKVSRSVGACVLCATRSRLVRNADR
jgi:hypothetical protein